MNSATPTIRVPQVWNEGYTGDGIRVAVVEDDPVDFNNQYLDHANGGTGPPEFAWYDDEMLHPTLTAGVIAMEGHSLYQGVAPDVTLYSADAGSYNPQSNIADASDWAINSPNYADVLNLSFGNSDPTLDFWSRYFDHVVWWRRRTVVAAGNEGGPPPPSMGNPDSGYNVLTVGGFDDHDNPNWSDDTISDFSSYEGPGSRDKPEVVAVANSICTTDLSADDVGCGHEGTSFAAPQVSGLAALLMQKTGVERRPELMKAIIIASAVHNIEGDSRLSDQDGAGGIDAALAYAVADHGRYGVADEGWYDYDTVYSSDFDGGGYLHYYIPASRGEKVRVVLAYDSHPDSTDPYNNDQLYSDLDLYAYHPSGSAIAASSSVVNNFEIVEFVADETGTYDVRVKKYSWNTTYEYIGIAWVKDATYLPDLRNKDGWLSEFYVCNNGAEENLAEDRKVYVYWFDSNGDPTPKDYDWYYLSPNECYWVPVDQWNCIPAGTTGSAIVSGGEDVSVVVETRSSTLAKAYTGVSSPDTTAYLPALYHSALDSEITVQNAASASVEIDVHYYQRDGDYVGQYDYTIPANGSISFTPPAGLGDDGSAYISGDGEIAAVSATTWSGGRAAEYNALTSANTTLYAPSIYRLKSGGQWILFSATILQNTTDYNASATLSYVNRDTGQTDLTINDTIPDHSAHGYNTNNGGSMPPATFYPLGEGWDGSVRATSNRALVGVGTTIWDDKSAAGHYRLFAPADGRSSVVLPLQYRHKSGSTWERWSAVNVMNVGAQTTDVTIKYYDDDGNLELTLPTQSLDSGQAVGANTRNGGDFASWRFDALGTNFTGSVQVTTSGGDQRIVAIANLLYPDKAAIYDGIGR